MPSAGGSTPPGPPAPPFGLVEVAPPQGSADLRPDGHVTAVFSAAVAESTLTTDTFQLYRQGTTVPIPATIRYDPQTLTATLIPASALETGGAYTAVIRGGGAGVGSLPGPALPADVAWSFTTGSGRPRWVITAIVVAVLAVVAVLIALLAGRGGDGASIRPEAIDFGDQAVGARSAARDVEVTNDGSDPVVVESIAIAGAHPGDFVQAGARTCAAGATIEPDATCALGVAFAPTAEGDRAADLAISLDDGSTLDVALSGTGSGEAAAVASPAQISFGQVVVGADPVTEQAAVRNTGTAPLAITVVALGGPAAGDYTIARATTCAAGTPVAPGDQCVVAVTFGPTQGGQRAAAVGVEYEGGSLQIGLAGTGEVRTEASLTPAQADFGSADAGTTGPPTTFTLRNTGATALAVSSVALQGATPRAFELGGGGTCRNGAQVAAGASCTVQVSFAPLAAGAVTATLSVVAGGEEWSAPLSGTGVSPTATTGTTTAP